MRRTNDERLVPLERPLMRKAFLHHAVITKLPFKIILSERLSFARSEINIHIKGIWVICVRYSGIFKVVPVYSKQKFSTFSKSIWITLCTFCCLWYGSAWAFYFDTTFIIDRNLAAVTPDKQECDLKHCNTWCKMWKTHYGEINKLNCSAPNLIPQYMPWFVHKVLTYRQASVKWSQVLSR